MRTARTERGWTQEDLAGASGLSTVQISRIECGRREIRLGTLIQVIDGLDIAPEALLHGLYGQSRRD